VKAHDGGIVTFRLEYSTKMEKLFLSYAQHKRIERSSLRFLLDGDRIKPEDTPRSLKLEGIGRFDVLASNAINNNDGSDIEILVKVKEAGGEVMCFKVKPTTKMEKIFQAYCQRRGVVMLLMMLIGTLFTYANTQIIMSVLCN